MKTCWVIVLLQSFFGQRVFPIHLEILLEMHISNCISNFITKMIWPYQQPDKQPTQKQLNPRQEIM